MKPQNLHAQEDRLLDLVYGELPPLEARAVESHLEGCTRCSELLADIRGVRTTMAQLPMESAPDAGLESLLAYAQQAARNAAAGPAPKATWWRRWMVPVASVAAVCLFGIVSIQVSKSVDLSPQLSAHSESTRTKEDSAPERMSEPKAPEPSPVAAPAPMPTAAAPSPVVQLAPPADAVAAPTPEQKQQLDSLDPAAAPRPEEAQAGDMTPPPSSPPAKLAEAFLAK